MSGCIITLVAFVSSVSAFSPICNPTVVPWGEKVDIFNLIEVDSVSSQAFTGYLGSVEAGKAYDATELVSSYSGPKVDLDKNGRK